MRYLSICSGIEAASVAWAPLEWEPVAFVEVEPFPCAVLAHHYPGVRNLGDMRKVKWGRYRGRVDVVVGGTPCQAFSVAGLRQSLRDERGNLTLEYVRAVHAIRPRFAVWENVPGVLSTEDNAFGCFLAALIGADEALEIEEGWPCAGMVSGPEGSAAWRVLDAQFFGLAQRRRRVFVVFCPGDGADPAEILFERPRLLGNPPARGEAGQGSTARAQDGAGVRGEWPAEVAPTLNTSWADRSAGSQAQEWDSERGGDSCQSPSAETTQGGAIDVATACNAHGGPHGRLDFESETFVAHALRADGFDASEDGTGRGTPLVPAIGFYGNDSGNDAAEELCPTLRAMPGGGNHPAVAYPIQEVGKRTGTSTTDPRAGIGIGNEGDPMYTLQAGAQHGVLAIHENQRGEISLSDTAGSLKVGGGKPGQGYPAVAFNLRGREGGAMPEVTDVASLRAASGGSSRTYVGVRRLLPVECARLQGFPDDYLDIEFRGKPAADGPKYRALGNSFAVPVIRWIGERIAHADRMAKKEARREV